VSAFTPGAETGSLDHRVAEVVAVIATYLTDAEADPEADPMLLSSVVQLHALLHGHRAGQGG
jgi:hypothetical protein